MEGFDDFDQAAPVIDGMGSQPLSGAYSIPPTASDGFGAAQADGFAVPQGSQGFEGAMGAAPADAFGFGDSQQADDLSDFNNFGSEAPVAAAPSAAATTTVPPPVDARVAWRATNAELLTKKDADEQVAKKAVEATAQAFLKEFYEKHAALVARAKTENREVQEAAKLKPTGDTAWGRVMSLIDFKFDSGRQKEVERERFKNLLFTAKEKKVPVHPPYVEASA